MSGRALRLADAHFPEALDHALAEQEITSGWIAATAVLEDVEIRVFDPIAGRPGARRKIAGRVEAVSLAGPITSTENGPFCVLRAVLSRETDTGLETFAGHLVAARVLAFDGWIADASAPAIDVASPRNAVSTSPNANRGPTSSIGTRPDTPQESARQESPKKDAPPSPWAAAASASEANEDRYDPPPRREASTLTMVETAPMPRPPARPLTVNDDVYPEAGDMVDHFAFGRCEVMKSDGDRLHVKIPRDGRLKEIAVEMLKVTAQGNVDGKRLFRLDRRM